MNLEYLYRYIFSAVISICGFLIVSSYNRVNSNIERLNIEVLQLKTQLIQISSNIIDEDKVKSIIKDELLKHGIKD